MFRKWVNNKTGLAIQNYIEELRKDKSIITANPAVKYVAAHIVSCITVRKNYIHRGMLKSFLFNRFTSTALTTSYLFFCHIFVKILYLILTLLQIFMLNYWLRDHHYDISDNLILGSAKWKLSERFPRMTLCKFDVFVHMNDKQNHWLQCTLPMNIFIEKIYIAIWFWLWFLLAMITIGIFYTLFKALPTYRYNLIGKHVSENKKFLYELLGIDGIITLGLISSNTNDINVNAILKEFSLNSQDENIESD